MNRVKLKVIFDELTNFTYIYGTEDEVAKIVNKYLIHPLTRDEYGNYFVKVGESRSLFLSHLDTVSNTVSKVNKIYYTNENGKEFVKTDGNTILGADDKTGVTIMINMINENIPGLYYFLIGEEASGTIGSGLLYKEKASEFIEYDRCVSFDRKGYGSIICRQKGLYCCSEEFVNGLKDEFAKSNMIFKADNKGVTTDSALFVGIIPECTNLSVGYFHEHHTTEEQDLDYMYSLCNAVCRIDWESLPVVRGIKNEFDTEDPEERQSEETDLPEYKLRNIFDALSKIIREDIKAMCSNKNWFTPDKEMLFYILRDVKGENSFSVFIYWDGSIKFKKENRTLKFKTLLDFKIVLKERPMILDNFIDPPKKQTNILNINGNQSNNIKSQFTDKSNITDLFSTRKISNFKKFNNK